MGYMKIPNLYKSQEILMFHECFVLEKIHGTSSHISMQDNKLHLFSGGAQHELFVKLFDIEDLKEKLQGLNVTVYGEAYGGELQRMSETYGPNLKFVVFDVKINDCWLDVPKAEKFTLHLGLEFVDYVKCATDLSLLNFERDKPSTQAMRNGCGSKQREGVVLRPLIELSRNNGGRLIAKYKADSFCETRTKREVSEEDLKVLREATEVAEEWVTAQRLLHILSKLEGEDTMENMREIIGAMQKDVRVEGEGEIMWGRTTNKAIAKQTAIEMKRYLQKSLVEGLTSE